MKAYLLNGVVEHEFVEDGDSVSEGEDTIDNKDTVSPSEDGTRLMTGLVEVDEALRIS